ncbi:MAG: RnfABCDGE type electron transport complex subunit D [Endomicrobiia bacterium]
MNENIIVTISPHIKSRNTVQKVMLDVIIACIPIVIASTYFYSTDAIKLIFTCVIFSCLSEFAFQKITKRKTTINDLSAVVTGLLLAFCLPPKLPLWIAAIGATFSITFGKQIFGGLGYNPFNPALIGRAFLQVSWPKEMGLWVSPFDGLTSATPLTISKLNLSDKMPDFFDMFLGNISGSLGEISKFSILLGALYLLLRNQIKLYIPLSYILSVTILAFIFNSDPLFHVLTGGLLLGAFFMATDPVTTPITKTGKIIFGIGCGSLTILIRIKGGFPEGVCYSILIMNMFTPLIDKITKIKRFGG